MVKFENVLLVVACIPQEVNSIASALIHLHTSSADNATACCTLLPYLGESDK